MAAKSWWLAALAALALASGPVRAEEDEPEEEEAAQSLDAEEGTSTAQSMFEFLVAEMAAQRGDTEGALAIYHRMARELRDPQIARRAVELAIRVRSFAPALQSAALLLELEPESALAREIIAAVIANDGDLAKARDTVAGLIDKSGNRGAMLMQLSHLFSKFPNKAKVLETIQALAERHAGMPESHYAVGFAALVANQLELAKTEAGKALEAKPGWDQAAVLKAQILRKSSPQEIIPFYQAFLAEHPASFEVRMQLGRELAGDRKLGDARDQFRLAEKISPRDAQAPYAVGLLSLQLEDYVEAQGAFTRSLKLGYREAEAIYLGLGQAAEGLKRVDEAIAWYQKVESGDWVRAQLKIATLVARQQGLAAGREYLQRIQPRSSEDRVQMIQVEAQLLRDAKAWRETYDMLSKAVDAYPDSFELLYDRAMAAERVDLIDVLEADLRRVIKMKPDYAHAYNALGYTLADRTNRLDEARELIDKAHRLSPDDPFILDSLGWVNYRLGNTQEALRHLHLAYSTRPDPEIAAHLGEVLWKSGQRDEAQKIWGAALTENPNHETLLAVIQKYRH